MGNINVEIGSAYESFLRSEEALFFDQLNSQRTLLPWNTVVDAAINARLTGRPFGPSARKVLGVSLYKAQEDGAIPDGQAIFAQVIASSLLGKSEAQPASGVNDEGGDLNSLGRGLALGIAFSGIDARRTIIISMRAACALSYQGNIAGAADALLPAAVLLPRTSCSDRPVMLKGMAQFLAYFEACTDLFNSSRAKWTAKAAELLLAIP